jgi:glucokinase
MLEERKNRKHYLGIEIGGTKFQTVIGDSNANIIDRYRTHVERNLGGAGIRKEIRKAIAHLDKYKPISIGLGFGGPIDFKKGKVCTSHQINGWNNFPVGPWLKKISGLPAKVDNDANVAALAEALKGAGKNNERVFFITLGSGMGGGMVLNGQIYHGEKPGESEIGLMPFDRKGNNMESQCCGWSVDRKIREYTKSNPKGILAKLTKGMTGGEAKYLITAIEKGEKAATEILDKTADNIAFAISYVVLLFHPKIIIIGGGLSLIGEPLVRHINESLPKYVPAAFHPVPKVKVAGLGEDVVCIGALLLAIQAEKEQKSLKTELNK